MSRRRLLPLLVWALGCGLAAGRAQTVASVTADSPPPDAAAVPGLAELAAILPAWSTTASVQTALGYKDNLLLSHAGEEASGFVRGGVNATAIHLRLGERTNYSFSLNAAGTRYFSGTSVDHDANANLLARGQLRLGDAFRFTFIVLGYYQDQIFDVSDTDVQRLVAQLKVTGGIAGPTLRWQPVSWLWLEVRTVGKRASYRDSDFNHTVGDGSVRLGWRPGARFEASIAGTERSRDYDDHPKYSVSGRELAGTHLKIFEREAELRLEATLDRAEHWKTTTVAGQCDFRDNGSGYSNYRERKVEQELDWASGAWLMHAEGAAKHLLYDVQTVGLGIDPPARVREEFSAQLRVERKLNERWTLYGEVNWERNRSNDPIASYNMNEGLLGVRWNWEK